VLLAEQDRSLWDRPTIDEGRELTERALRMRRPPGPYAIEAAVAALHCSVERPADMVGTEPERRFLERYQPGAV
jgi:RNA polymerase sigma-70 factor, ECF subfamily